MRKEDSRRRFPRELKLAAVQRMAMGANVSRLSRELGVSRKTAYKIFNRYKDEGLYPLTDRSRRPVRYANQLPAQVEWLIVDLKRNKPHWGRPQNPRAPGPAARRQTPC